MRTTKAVPTKPAASFDVFDRIDVRGKILEQIVRRAQSAQCAIGA